MDLRRQMQEKSLAGTAKAPVPPVGASPSAPPADNKDRLRAMFGNRNIEALSKKKTPAQRLLGQDRKYFDSGDWVLSKAGRAGSIDTASVGSEHPVPEKIPHLCSPVGTVQQHPHPSLHRDPSSAQHSSQHTQHQHQASSPIKETSFLSQETKPDDSVGPAASNQNENKTGSEAANRENYRITS